MKRIKTELSVALLLLGMMGSAAAIDRSTPFSDMTGVDKENIIVSQQNSKTDELPSGWAAAEVQKAIDRGYVPIQLQHGYRTVITRSRFCDLMVSAAEKEFGPINGYGDAGFEDTDSVNVSKMTWLGIVQGVGGSRFDPDGLLTREQAAAMLARLQNRLTDPPEKRTPGFADRDSISSWALEAVGQMEHSGIMKGVEGNCFDPKGRYTLEQSILTMLRLMDVLNAEI